MSRTPTKITRSTPAMGEHNAEIYATLELDDADLARLREEKVI